MGLPCAECNFLLCASGVFNPCHPYLNKKERKMKSREVKQLAKGHTARKTEPDFQWRSDMHSKPMLWLLFIFATA